LLAFGLNPDWIRWLRICLVVYIWSGWEIEVSVCLRACVCPGKSYFTGTKCPQTDGNTSNFLPCVAFLGGLGVGPD